MMNRFASCIWRATGALSTLLLLATAAAAADQVPTNAGIVEGTVTADGKIHVFEGIPYAAPPVGDLRWKEPQPVPHWDGVRKATEFGPRCMQAPVFPDMVFHDPGPSEACLNLNVWTPSLSPTAKLPVMVWIFGGGFVAGATSEGRQDGEFLAHKGVVVVSMDYRLGIFGFFAHPELTAESPHHASGNYGLMDQTAALQWVRDNIAAFGGDPGKVTIFGESAGSFSVSAQMASPVSKNLINGAIGESGAFFGRTLGAKSLADSEKAGAAFGASIGAPTLAALRAMPAQQLLDASMKERGAMRFGPNIDGYFFPTTAAEIYAKGEQAHVPLLAGWNHDEGNYHAFFAKDAPTKENFVAIIDKRYGDKAPEVLKLFPANTDEEAQQSAGVLATAQFIGYGTWKWIDTDAQTSDAPVYRYEFDRPPPMAPDASGVVTSRGAYHSSEIEYVFGALASKPLPWRPEDYKLSGLMETYWTDFAKTGNPNGKHLPKWPRYDHSGKYWVMHLSPKPKAAPDNQRAQYELLDKLASEAASAAPAQ